MKTNPKTKPSSSLDLTLPTSWDELTPQQLLDVCAFSVTDRPEDYVKMLLLMKWNGLSVAQRKGFRKPMKGCEWLRKGNRFYHVRTDLLAAAATTLDFLSTPPESPIRPQELHGHVAVRADLRDTVFGIYLEIENYYQGFLSSKNPAALDRMAMHLYPGFEGSMTEAERFAVILWMTGVKNMFSRQFTELFRSAGNDGENHEQHDVMLA